MSEDIIEINSLQEFLNLAKENKMTEEEKILREYVRKKISKIISNSKKFIALNAQINANNIGFHTLFPLP